MPDATPGKGELRALALARRAALTEEARRAASDRAAAHLIALLRPRETVALFWPMRGEIDPRGLVAPIHDGGGHVAMPVIGGRRMVFRLYDGEDCMEPGAFGTRHPHAGHPVVEPDLIVAPLAAFDRRGGRIGYGGGYYDRATAELRARSRPYRIAGIAFACQEVAAVPVEAHDEMLPVIATERELIHTGCGA